MNLSQYFFNLIQKSDGLSPDQIRDNIRTQLGKTFHVVADGFAPTFLSPLLLFPKVELLFSSDDSFSLDNERSFINGLNELQRKQAVFLSKGFTRTEIEDLIKLKTSIFIWDQSGNLQRPSDLVKWANMSKGLVWLRASGYNASVLKLCLGSALKVLIRKNDFDLATIQGLIVKGKEKVTIVADGFEQADLDDFKTKGAIILQRVQPSA